MKTAFLFPGQGSQSVGMMAPLAHFPEIRATFDTASEALGEDLWTLVSAGPLEHLNQTTLTQPVMLAAGVATWRVWRALGGDMPDLLAGHSLGELTALVAAGALEYTSAIKLVRLRAQLMQAAVPAGQGGMAAILGLDDDAVRAVCAEAAQGAVVEAVNFNSPGQVVIAGEAIAVERAVVLAKAAGAKRAVPLPVSVPAHSSLMQPAADAFRAALSEVTFTAPLVPVIHNADARAQQTPDGIREALVRQLVSPVRWVECIRLMSAQGVERFAECGPGKVLAGLNKRICDIPATALVDDAALRSLQ
jgi:[acyl-carrier-protein] S-malonyltransferase